MRRKRHGPLEWVGPDGATLSTIGKPANYELGSLSPDGQRLAVEIRDGVAGTTDVWIVDLRRNVSSRLTFRASDDSLPIWSPDGSQVAFAGLNDGVYDIFVKAASGQGDETLIGTSELHKFADDWSPDGRHLALTTFDPSAKKTQTRWILDIESGSMEPVDEPGFDERNGRFSPDARWMAYESRESGRWEVYVAPFPAPGGKWQVSSDGGSLAFWSQTGDQLYFRNGDALLVVDVTAQGDSLEIGSPRKLFEGPVDRLRRAQPHRRTLRRRPQCGGDAQRADHRGHRLDTATPAARPRALTGSRQTGPVKPCSPCRRWEPIGPTGPAGPTIPVRSPRDRPSSLRFSHPHRGRSRNWQR